MRGVTPYIVHGQLMPPTAVSGAYDGLLPEAGDFVFAEWIRAPTYMILRHFDELTRAKALRTVEALWNALGDIVACFSPAECANFLRHAGYF